MRLLRFRTPSYHGVRPANKWPSWKLRQDDIETTVALSRGALERPGHALAADVRIWCSGAIDLSCHCPGPITFYISTPLPNNQTAETSIQALGSGMLHRAVTIWWDWDKRTRSLQRRAKDDSDPKTSNVPRLCSTVQYNYLDHPPENSSAAVLLPTASNNKLISLRPDPWERSKNCQ